MLKEHRTACAVCGNPVHAEVNENGTFFDYYCSTCGDETATRLEYWDGVAWMPA